MDWYAIWASYFVSSPIRNETNKNPSHDNMTKTHLLCFYTYIKLSAIHISGHNDWWWLMVWKTH